MAGHATATRCREGVPQSVTRALGVLPEGARSSTPREATNVPNPEANKATVARFLEIFSQGDVEKTLNALTDDVTWWVSGGINGMSGSYDKDGFGKLIGGVADVYVAPLRITPTSMVAEGDRVAVEADSYAELKDGRVYDPRCHFLFQVAPDERIALVHEYLDTKLAYDIFFTS